VEESGGGGRGRGGGIKGIGVRVVKWEEKDAQYVQGEKGG